MVFFDTLSRGKVTGDQFMALKWSQIVATIAACAQRRETKNPLQLNDTRGDFAVANISANSKPNSKIL